MLLIIMLEAVRLTDAEIQNNEVRPIVEIEDHGWLSE